MAEPLPMDDLMKRRELILLGLAAALPSFPAFPQTTQMRRIGWLGTTPPSTQQQHAIVETFLQVLRDNGFVEGQNITIERRYSLGQEDRHSSAAAELVAMGVELIVTISSPATLAAKRATSSIPIVMASVANPEQQGLVASLARPGANVTGVSNALIDTHWKTYQLIQEAMPGRSHIAILWNPDSSSSSQTFNKIDRPATKQFGLMVVSGEVRGPADLERVFQTVLREKAEVLYPHAAMFAHQEPILSFASAHRLPVVVALRHWAPAGALMTLSPDLRDQFRRAGFYVVKILNGAKPAEMPVEQPTKIEIVINLKAAQALSIDLPLSLLASADEVIE